MLGYLFAREVGATQPSILRSNEQLRRTLSIHMSKNKTFTCENDGSVNAIDIDNQEGRYLICGCGDASLAIYNMSETMKGSVSTEFNAICRIPRGNQGHSHGVTSVQWYPHDTGLFFSAGFDHSIKVWDTNRLYPVCEFSADNMVYHIALSPISLSHNLVASATRDNKIRLADLRSGGFTHCLLGHSQEVRTVDWAPSNEFILASGSADHTIRLWDIRRAGVMLVLNQHNTDITAHKSDVATDAHDGIVTSLKYTPDGLFLLSSGHDNRLKLWDTTTGKNTLVNYTGIRNKYNIHNQMTISQNGQFVYHPNGSVIGVYDIHSGTRTHSLVGHFDKVHCCKFHPFLQELYSGSADQNILCWTPSIDEKEENEISSEPEDEWSDDEL